MYGLQTQTHPLMLSSKLKRKRLGGPVPTFPDGRHRRRSTDIHTVEPRERSPPTHTPSNHDATVPACFLHVVCSTHFYLYCLNYIIGISVSQICPRTVLSFSLCFTLSLPRSCSSLSLLSSVSKNRKVTEGVNCILLLQLPYVSTLSLSFIWYVVHCFPSLKSVLYVQIMLLVRYGLYVGFPL